MEIRQLIKDIEKAIEDERNFEQQRIKLLKEEIQQLQEKHALELENEKSQIQSLTNQIKYLEMVNDYIEKELEEYRDNEKQHSSSFWRKLW